LTALLDPFIFKGIFTPVDSMEPLIQYFVAAWQRSFDYTGRSNPKGLNIGGFIWQTSYSLCC
jgi:hypothetical protein